MNVINRSYNPRYLIFWQLLCITFVLLQICTVLAKSFRMSKFRRSESAEIVGSKKRLELIAFTVYFHRNNTANYHTIVCNYSIGSKLLYER